MLLKRGAKSVEFMCEEMATAPRFRLMSELAW
jgi:hypothetical protein